MPVLVTVEWRADLGELPAHNEALQDALSHFREQPGRRWTRICVDRTDPTHVLLLAEWVSPEAYTRAFEAAPTGAMAAVEALQVPGSQRREQYSVVRGPTRPPDADSVLLARVTDVPPEQLDVTLDWMKRVREAMAERGIVARSYESLARAGRFLVVTEVRADGSFEGLAAEIFARLPPPIPIDPRAGFVGRPIYASDAPLRPPIDIFSRRRQSRGDGPPPRGD